MRKDKLFVGIFFLCYFVWMVWTALIEKRQITQLQEQHKVTFGFIQKFGYNAGGARVPGTYTYKVNNIRYEGDLHQSDFCKKLYNSDKGIIRAKKYLIVYNPNTPEIHQIILSKEDYLRYGIPYPDSLSSFLDKYFNCD